MLLTLAASAAAPIATNPLWLSALLYGCLTAIALASLLPISRIIRGPTLVDRSIGLDTLLANVVASIGIFCIIHRTDAYVTAMLIVVLLGFLGSVCLGRFFEMGQILPEDEDDPTSNQNATEEANDHGAR